MHTWACTQVGKRELFLFYCLSLFISFCACTQWHSHIVFNCEEAKNHSSWPIFKYSRSCHRRWLRSALVPSMADIRNCARFCTLRHYVHHWPSTTQPNLSDFLSLHQVQHGVRKSTNQEPSGKSRNCSCSHRLLCHLNRSFSLSQRTKFSSLK
jgi:hypothetical protein